MNNVVGFTTSNSNLGGSQTSRSSEIKKSSINNFVDSLDVLQLFSTVGKKRAFSLYAIGWFAFIMINAAIIVILIPVNDPIAQQNNQVLHSNNMWQMNNNKDLMESHHLNLIIKDKNHKKQTHDMQTKTENEQFDTTKLLLGFDEEDELNGIPISSTAFNIDLEKSTLPHEFCLNLSIRNKKSQIQSNKKITNMPSCDLIDGSGSESHSGVKIVTTLKTQIAFLDMIKQEICLNDIDCQEKCELHQGKVSHGACYARFSPAEVCLVLKTNQNDKKEISFWSFENGCFSGSQMFKYNFQDEVKTLKIVGRNAEDPVLKALKFSENFAPIKIRSTKEQKISRILFTVGAITLLSLSAFVMVLKFNTFNALQIEPKTEDSHIDISFDRSHL